MHDLGLDAINFTLLFLNFLLQVCQLVLQRVQHFLGNSLLLLQLRLAGNAFPLPVLVLLVHRIDIVSYEINTLPQWVSALTENLDGFLHELNIVF